MGWPEDSRNIAISNGNECGVDNGFVPGDAIAIIDSDTNPTIITDFINLIIAPVVGFARYDPLLVIAGGLPGRSKWKANFDIETYGFQGQSNRIYRGRLRYYKKALWIGPEIRVTLFNKSINKRADILPYDSFSGGLFDIDDVTGSLPGFLPDVQFVNRRFGFIPVVSALDIRKANGNDPTPDDYLKSYSGGMPQDPNLMSSFDNFIVDNLPSQPTNNNHISFQTRNGNWLASELNAATPADVDVLIDCSWACEASSFGIQGPDTICQTATFSLPDGADTYEWTSNNLNVTRTTVNGNAVNFTRQNNFNGYVTISAILNSEVCEVENLQISREIYIGVPVLGDTAQVLSNAIPSLSISEDDYCEQVSVRFPILSPDLFEYDEIEMRKIAPSQSYWDGDFRNGTIKPEVAIFPNCNEQFIFEARARNSCGWSEWTEYNVDLDVCDNDCTTGNGGNTNNMSDNFIISPIPASVDITISFNSNPTWTFTPTQCYPGLTNQNGDPLCDYHVIIEMYDLADMRQLFIKRHKVGTSFDVSGLISGTYILKISHGNQEETHQIVVN